MECGEGEEYGKMTIKDNECRCECDYCRGNCAGKDTEGCCNSLLKKVSSKDKGNLKQIFSLFDDVELEEIFSSGGDKLSAMIRVYNLTLKKARNEIDNVLDYIKTSEFKNKNDKDKVLVLLFKIWELKKEKLK